MKKKLAIGVVVVLALAVGGFVVWAETPFQATAEAAAALQSDGQVQVDMSRWITFEPAAQAETGLVVYPGGRVDERAYAPIAHRLAERGYLVVILPVRLHLAFFDINAAEPVLSAFGNIHHWAVGGHSLGGVAASEFAASHPQIEGLVLWASYPADDKLRNRDLHVVSIYGSQDGLATDVVKRSQSLLPADARFIEMEGGNHAQFGAYGLQPGDGAATIPPEAQWEKAAEATSNLLASLSQ